MKSYTPSDVRSVGFFGHRGSGKTMLVEALLFNAKATPRLGSVDGKNLALELDEGALERHATMAANVGFIEWNGCRIGIIDTPGDGNFWGATNRAAHVVDAAVLTVSAADGVETVTLRAAALLKELGIPFAVYVSKLDKDNVDFERTLEQIKADLSKDAVALSLPIGVSSEFCGIVNLLTERAVLDNDGTPADGDAPAGMADELEEARELLFDAVAAADDDLAEKYLEELTLTEDELHQGLRAAFGKGDLVPVFAGSSTRNIGPSLVADVIQAVFPSPLERPVVKGYASAKQESPVERTADPNGPLVVQVFRNYHDPFAGNLAYARVWSGTLHASADVINSTRDQTDRPSHLYLPLGGTKTGSEIKQASCGDLIVLTKLKSTHTGDTLTSKDEPTFLVPFAEPDALLSFGLVPAEQKDEDKLAAFVHRLCEEDPSLKFERDPESKEMLLGGLGQAHIDHVLERLDHANIHVTLKEPKVPYRESFRGKVMGIEGKHKKQSGGHGQFGVCFINVEPLPRGTGVEFVDKIVGGAIPRNYIPSVERGVRDALLKGPLSGSVVVDVRVTLYDGKYHRVDSSDMAFQVAARKAVKELYDNPKAKPVLLEPYMELDIACPAGSVGDVMGDLNSRRARVNDMTTEGDRGKINAAVPTKEILRYANVLKSLTAGRGSFSMKFARYEEAPPNTKKEVSEAYAASTGDD